MSSGVRVIAALAGLVPLVLVGWTLSAGLLCGLAPLAGLLWIGREIAHRWRGGDL